MIIIGYPCIGKSSLASVNKWFIDLESSYFRLNAAPDADWIDNYVKTALYLSDQGYNVFVSSHEDVYKRLFTTDLLFNYEYYGKGHSIMFCYPAKTEEMCKTFTDKSAQRYKETGLSKDRRAYERISHCYHSDIGNMEIFIKNNNLVSKTLVLDSPDYVLAEEIQKYIDQNNSNLTQINDSTNYHLMKKIFKYIVDNNKETLSNKNLKDSFNIGYDRAKRVMDWLEEVGVITKQAPGAKLSRNVNMTQAKDYLKFMESHCCL